MYCKSDDEDCSYFNLVGFSVFIKNPIRLQQMIIGTTKFKPKFPSPETTYHQVSCLLNMYGPRKYNIAAPVFVSVTTYGALFYIAYSH